MSTTAARVETLNGRLMFCKFNYVLKCDVRKFFPSMDHAVLKTTIRQTIACRDTLWLLPGAGCAGMCDNTKAVI